MKKEPSAPISGYSSSHLRPQVRLLAGQVTTLCVHPTGPGVPDAPLLLPAHLSPFGPRGSSPRIPQSRTSACGGFIGSDLLTLVGLTTSGMSRPSSGSASPQPVAGLGGPPLNRLGAYLPPVWPASHLPAGRGLCVPSEPSPFDMIMIPQLGWFVNPFRRNFFRNFSLLSGCPDPSANRSPNRWRASRKGSPCIFPCRRRLPQPACCTHRR